MKKYFVVYNITCGTISDNIEFEIESKDKITAYLEAKEKMKKDILSMETKSYFSIVLLEEKV